jgi:Spy/CpxP family protein refolding chaperone
MGRKMTAAVLAATLAAGVAPVAASADEWRGGYGYEHGGYEHGGGDRDGWRDREAWRAREWREHQRHEYWEHAYGYAPAPAYGGYYAWPARPRVYYAPPYGY